MAALGCSLLLSATACTRTPATSSPKPNAWDPAFVTTLKENYAQYDTFLSRGYSRSELKNQVIPVYNTLVDPDVTFDEQAFKLLASLNSRNKHHIRLSDLNAFERIQQGRLDARSAAPGPKSMLHPAFVAFLVDAYPVYSKGPLGLNTGMNQDEMKALVALWNSDPKRLNQPVQYTDADFKTLANLSRQFQKCGVGCIKDDQYRIYRKDLQRLIQVWSLLENTTKS